MSDPLSSIREVDTENQLDAVLAMPDHLRDALWRIDSARLGSLEAPAAIACGMGGSAIGGDLAVAAYGDRLSAPFVSERGYALPAWAPNGSAVLCSSYSGNTEETLSCFEAAGKIDAKRLVATTGGELAGLAREQGVPVIGLPAGLRPRAAVGYMLAVSAELARVSGAAPSLHSEIEAAAVHLESRREALAEASAAIASQLTGSAPVIHGAGLTAAVAMRWKAQINENSKTAAFFSELPESNHNELVGWEGSPESGRFACVLLADPDQHPRTQRRLELTAKLAEPGASAVVRVSAEGATRTERMMELVMLGDLVSLQMAAARGIDPSPVAVIDQLKSELGRP